MRTWLLTALMAAAVAIGRADDAWAAASVAAATGGSAISADTAAGTYTTLTGPRLTESDKNGIGLGSIVLVAPPYFEFNPSARVTVAVTGSRRGSDLVLSNSVAAVTKSTITIDVAGTSFPNARRSTLTWSGIQVRPTLGSPLVSGHISRTGTAAFAESGSAGNYGSLATAPGPVSNLMVALPGQSFTAGVGISGTASPQTAGVAFAFASMTAADQHYNVVTSYSGTRAISYSGPGGTPSFTTSVTFSNGQSATALATILRVAETTTVTASDGTVAGPPSSVLTVHRGPYTRLQVLVPGETPAPGTAVGKTGTPVAQAAGVGFGATARAVDDGWNLIETATDTVSLAATDANAVFAASLALASGTGEFTVAFRTAGTQTLAAASRSTTGVASAASAAIAVSPAAFDRLQALAPGESALPGTSAGRTGTPASVVSGSAITVTVHAVDAFWNVVPTADFVGLTASDGQAAMPPGAALINGILAIPVVLKTAGLTTVTASNLSNGAIASGATPALTVLPGPFTRLQVLAPGETAAPGSPAGKTGVALPQSAGVGFPLAVRAADDNWNLVDTVTDTVQFASSDGFASLPPTGPLAPGSNTLSATLNTVGMQTISATDLTDASRLASTSSIIPVGMAELHLATGGGTIPADGAGGTYTVLTGPVIMEGAPGNIGAGTIVLSAPPGFEFDPGHAVTVTVSGTGAGTDVVLASPAAAVSPAAVSITVSEASAGSRLSTLTWSGLQVRPTSGSPLATGVITNSGSSVLSGIAPDSSFGALAEVPGAAARLAVEVEPSPSATAGVAFARQPQVRIEDQFGNLRTNDGATVVSAARAAGSGPLRGSPSAISRNGLASFADLFHEVAGTISIAFSAPGLPGVTSASIAVAPAAASRLDWVQPPAGTSAGVTLAPPPAVQVHDPFGNSVAGAGRPVTLWLSSGSGVISGVTSTLTAVSGLAVFDDLHIDQAGSKTLTASATGLTSTVSDPFVVAPAAAAQLVITQPPSGAVAGETIAPAVAVQIRDALGNDVTNAGHVVSLALATGVGQLAGTTQRTADAHGRALFSDLSVAAAGVKTISATGTGLTSALSGPFTISPGGYARVQILAPGESALPGTETGRGGKPDAQKAGEPFTVTVSAVDPFWNVVGTVSNDVDVYSSDAAASLPPGATLVSGARSFQVTLNTAGAQTLTVEDLTDESIADDTTPPIAVVTTWFTQTVTSAHGAAAPAPGVHTNGGGTVATNIVISPVEQGGTQCVCTGWTMTGNAPASGTSNFFVMIVTNNCSLTWLWKTNYLLGVTAAPHGSVSGSTGGWYALGAAAAVTAAPQPYYHFGGWSGDVQGDTNGLGMSLAMDRPRAVGASFAEDLAAQGTPHWWLAQNALTNRTAGFDAAELEDTDGEGAMNWQEYVAGTIPTNPASCLRIASISAPPSVTVEFGSVTGRTYTLLRSTGLTPGVWTNVPGMSAIPGNAGTLSLTDSAPASPLLLRVSVRKP